MQLMYYTSIYKLISFNILQYMSITKRHREFNYSSGLFNLHLMENLHSLLLLLLLQAAPIHFFRPNGAPVKNDYRQHAAVLPEKFYARLAGHLLHKNAWPIIRSFFLLKISDR